MICPLCGVRKARRNCLGGSAHLRRVLWHQAGTFETATRGLLFDHRPSSLPAERLAAALEPAILEAGQGAGSSFERDAAVVLRRVAERP